MCVYFPGHNSAHINNQHQAYSVVVVCVWFVKCLKTAKRKSQNPNELNEIDSEKKSMNERVSPDPRMHIFCVICANYDTLTQKKTFVFTKINLFVQNTAHSFNSELCTRKLKGVCLWIVKHTSSLSFIRFTHNCACMC